MKKLLSVIVPVYNEEQNIPLIYDALKKVWNDVSSMSAYEYEFIFVDDGSHDHSVQEVQALMAKDSNVLCIEFSRNFGKEMATTAGIHAAKGDAVIMLDGDLQHPPEHIPDFVAKWEAGAEVVVGVRTGNTGEGFVKKWGSLFFYRIMGLIGETELLPGGTDFRLIDRVVVDAFKELSERRRMTRTLINWLGFRKETIPFKAPARRYGKPAYTVSKLVRLAFNTFISNSLLPLRITGRLGVLIVIVSGMLGIAVFAQRYIFGDVLGWNVTGSAQLAIINVFLIGIVLMMLGLIALYIENIHVEVSGRPLYVIRKNKKE